MYSSAETHVPISRIRKRIDFSEKVLSDWHDMRVAMKEAAVPFTKDKSRAVPVHINLMWYVAGCEKEVESALCNVGPPANKTESSADIMLDGPVPYIEVSWLDISPKS